MTFVTVPMRWGGISHWGEGFVILEDTLVPDKKRVLGRTHRPGSNTVVIPFPRAALQQIRDWLSNVGQAPEISIAVDTVVEEEQLAFEFNDQMEAAKFKLFWG